MPPAEQYAAAQQPASIPPRNSQSAAAQRQEAIQRNEAAQRQAAAQPAPARTPSPQRQNRPAQMPPQGASGPRGARQGTQQPPRPPAGPQGPAPAARPPRRRKKKTGRIIALVIVLALFAWPFGLMMWANSKLNHVDALSGAANTSGTTYLIAGSDSREDGTVGGNVKGARADTIMLLHVPKSGPSALISLPRDIYVPIPGHDSNKINASFSFGGPALLVETVENLTGLTVDHYVEVGFSGVTGIVDAIGGVELCLDYDVNDPQSELDWDAGCHPADGDTALAFARMRKADPLGDIGRAQRQRQVIGAISSSLKSPTKLLNPATQTSMVKAGTGALVVSKGTGFFDLGKMALAFRNANSKSGVTGTPPITSLDYRPGGVGSAVQLDDAATAQFFKDIAAGTLEPGEYNGLG